MIWVIGGTCDFRRAREWSRLKLHLEKSGQRISTHQADDPFGDPPWLLVENADKIKKLDPLLKGNVIVLWAGKKPEKAAWLAGVEKRHQVWHDSPTPWEAAGVAQEFVVQEGSRLGLAVSQSDAQRLVAASGTELALLSREVQKMALAGSCAFLDALATGWGAAPLDDLMVAIAKQDSRTVVRLLPRFGSGSTGAIQVSRLLATQVLVWLAASELESKDLSTDLIAEQVGVHPYRYRVGMQENVRRLGYRKIRDLVHRLAVVEAAVLEGKVNAWGLLQASLLDWCTGT